MFELTETLDLKFILSQTVVHAGEYGAPTGKLLKEGYKFCFFLVFGTDSLSLNLVNLYALQNQYQ